MDERTLPPSFAARWFDGRTGAPHRATAVVHEGTLLLQREGELEESDGELEESSFRIADLRVAEPLLRAPRLIDLPDGGVLQIDESPRLAAALAANGVRSSVVVAWQRLWQAATVALVLLVAAAAWLYLVGLPRAAEWAAERVSPTIEEQLGDRTLAVLDRRLLAPSTVDAARRAELIKRFVDFQSRAGLVPARRIEFRSTRAGHGVNGFALPGGVIVLLDGLVELGDEDDEILLAVLAHECGHQAKHHMTRSMFRALGGVAVAALLWGDYSSVASNGVLLFGQLRYSRQDETDADDFALAALARAGISPDALARFFWQADAARRKAGVSSGPEWLSTHPGSSDRAERSLEAAETYRNARASSPRP